MCGRYAGDRISGFVSETGLLRSTGSCSACQRTRHHYGSHCPDKKLILS